MRPSSIPDVRAKLKRSRGFCAEHVEMLHRKPGRALGIALIYRDIIRLLAKLGEKARYEPETSLRVRVLKREQGGLGTAHQMAAEQACPACEIAKDAERLYVGLLTSHLQDDDLYAAYAQGEGLCLPHLLDALEQVTDESRLERLIKPQVGPLPAHVERPGRVHPQARPSLSRGKVRRRGRCVASRHECRGGRRRDGSQRQVGRTPVARPGRQVSLETKGPAQAE